MDLGLAGKRALITGGSMGIGRAVAQSLAAEGCSLVLAARDEAKLQTAATAIRSAHQVSVEIVPADLRRPDDQQRTVERAGDIDILVNNAGSNPGGQIDEISEEVWRASWDLKLFGYINMTRTVYAAMKTRRSGVIVNVIGNSGERMNARYILGSSGNIALMGLTRALGSRSPDFGIRVVGVNPGLTATERADFLLRGWSQGKFGTPDRAADVLAEMDLPFGRMGTVAEVADAIVFLASARASYISGTILTVDGGGADRHG